MSETVGPKLRRRPHEAWQTAWPFFLPLFTNFVERLSEKSRRGPQLSLKATETMLFGPFWALYTGQIHAQSVASSLFGQSRKVNSQKFSFEQRNAGA